MKLKKYHKPVATKWRKLGDSLLATSTMLTTLAIADDWSKWITIAIIITGVAGKFLTNFFGDDLI